MNILFAGKTGFDYNRVKILYKGLSKRDDVDVKIFRFKNKRHFDEKLFAEYTKNIDFIYVPPFRFKDAKFIKKQTDIPIIFDPLVSVFLTRIIDYKQYWKFPQKYVADFINLRSCDILLADTFGHKNYFSSVFKISKKKIFVLPIGVDTECFYPENKLQDKIFHVGFYGSFIPLQGIKQIIETANVLKNEKSVVFDITGNGYCYKSVKKLTEKYKLNNINFIDRVPYEKLPEIISKFDICLGIFGNSLKADIVIPNKIYHYAAMKKCIITKKTFGIKEIFNDKENIILTSIKPEEIAEKIIYLKNNPDIAEKTAQNAFELITKNYNEYKIAEKFIDICKKFKS